MDALHNIGKILSITEKHTLHNDVPRFKAKDPQSSEVWLDQIDKVTVLTNVLYHNRLYTNRVKTAICD